MHKAQKIRAGEYLYRNHLINKEEDYCGPEGGARPHWSISGDQDGPDRDSSHAELPQLNTLAAAKAWLDAYLDGGNFRQIADQNQPATWGA